MKVLVVDDDRNTVDAIIKCIPWETLEIEEVFHAYEIAGAKEIIQSRQTDIVICDIEMPMGTGIDLIAWAREKGISSEFLFLTCHESFEFASGAIRYHAAAYLVKPFVPEQMEEELRQLVRKLKRKRHLEESEKYREMWQERDSYEEEKDFAGKKSFQEKPVLDLQRIREQLAAGNAVAVLNYLKEFMEKMSARKVMNMAALQTIALNLTQIVYVHLYQSGIQADELFADRTERQLRNRAVESVVDMMKWQNYLIQKTVKYTREVQESDSIVQKIKGFVQEHYREEIGRNEAAAVVYLTPEYAAKLFKKETGMNLKDYIHQVRIQEAKMLLAGGGKVSEVAQKVGFDNFSYFSTVFKRMTGYSPNEYKRAGERIEE